MVVTHHIVSDLWSQALLIKNLAAGLSDNKIDQQIHWSYLDQVAHQKNYLQSEAADEDWGYWRQHLSGKLPVLSLPTDYQGDAQNLHLAASYDFSLPTALVESLRQLARKNHTSLNTVLLSAYALLLHRLSKQDDLLIGVPTAGFRQAPFDTGHGYFVNPVPLRSTLDVGASINDVISHTKAHLNAAIKHSALPFQQLVERLNPTRGDVSINLFNVMFSYNTNPQLRDAGQLILGQGQGNVVIDGIEFMTLEVPVPGAQADISLILSDQSTQQITARMVYRTAMFYENTISWWCQSYLALLNNMVEKADSVAASMPVLNQQLSQQLLNQWQGEDFDLDEGWNIPAALSEQALNCGDKTAMSCGEQAFSFANVEAQSNRLARYLNVQGVQKGARVGVFKHKSIETIVTLLAVMKAGAAYVPLDPDYPVNRLKYIAQNAELDLIIGDKDGLILWDKRSKALDILYINVSTSDKLIQEYGAEPLDNNIIGSDIAYVIYTSGSTGQPKGVPISHSNVANLCIGLDKKLPYNQASRLYTVTSISFDISVLEMFWTLTRGINVVLPQQAETPKSIPLKLSLMYFSADEDQGTNDLYQLVLEGAKKADQLGFDSVWVPERHFHSFGAAFPNPSVIASAIAAVTSQINIRAGSVVLPLHHPVRVTEEWSVVDVMSNGRVGIAFASGWHPDDFLFRPQDYQDRKAVMSERIDQVKSLWRGEAMSFTNGVGEQATITTRPRPMQKELPVWITAAGNIETFKEAGQSGANILTHMLGQNIQELEEKIAAYKQARQVAGFDMDTSCVTVMLHTYICEDETLARTRVEKPFKDYLRSSIELMRPLAESLGLDPQKNKELLVEHAFERYYNTSALFGTPASCRPLVEKVHAIGADEITCLIDFGVENQHVLDGLEQLAALMEKQPTVNNNLLNTFKEIEALDNITHLQCTPGYAKLLLSHDKGLQLLQNLDALMVGGNLYLVPWLINCTALDVSIFTICTDLQKPQSGLR